MSVRLASHTDSKQISVLLYEAFKEFRSLYTHGGFQATVLDAARVKKRMDEGITWVFDKDGIMGTLSAKHYAEGLYICGMAVHPSHRSLGIGRQLLATAERYAAEEGFSNIFLSTTPFLNHAIALYAACGFNKVNRPPFELLGTPLLTMEKSISK